MSSFAGGHGEFDHHQHHLAFALMLVAVAVSSVTIIVASHRVDRRGLDREPPHSVTRDCSRPTWASPAVRYCVYY